MLSIVGLGFLLLLAGLEVDYDRLRGSLLRLTALSYVGSLAIALGVGLAFWAGDLVRSPLLLAIMLSATGLGVILPILKDAGETSTPFGQVVIAGASIAEVVPIVLLSLFFSGEGGVGAGAVLLSAFAAFVLAVGVAIFAAEHSMRLSLTVMKLQDTTAEIRVRGAFLLLVLFVVLASEFGLEAILGAFLAGAILKLLDRDDAMTHTFFRRKLEAVGFGVFVPIFFVVSGVQFDLGALFADAATVAMVPLFLAALLAVRGLPALLYRHELGRAHTLAAALLQATSLPFIVAASMIGVELGLLDPGTAAGLVAAGLLSVLVFPLAALTVLRNAAAAPESVPRTLPAPSTGGST